MFKKMMIFALVLTSFSGLAKRDRSQMREKLKSMSAQEREAYHAERKAKRQARYENASEDEKARMDEKQAKRKAKRAARKASRDD